MSAQKLSLLLALSILSPLIYIPERVMCIEQRLDFQSIPEGHIVSVLVSAVKVCPNVTSCVLSNS